MLGHVHGRLQPLHDEHLDYFAWAAADCDRLVVGVTNADPSHVAVEDADPDRHRPENNPFTYYERYRMVAAVADRLPAAVDVVPFPINRPELWDDYAPADAVHFVNVLEPWHERKVERLRDHGRTVRTKQGRRTVSGTRIRERMAASGDWRADVPDPVVAVLDDVDAERRVRALLE